MGSGDNKEVANIQPKRANKSIHKSEAWETIQKLMISIGYDVLNCLQETILLLWRTQITFRIGHDSKLRKGNIELALFATQSQSSY